MGYPVFLKGSFRRGRYLWAAHFTAHIGPSGGGRRAPIPPPLLLLPRTAEDISKQERPPQSACLLVGPTRRYPAVQGQVLAKVIFIILCWGRPQENGAEDGDKPGNTFLSVSLIAPPSLLLPTSTCSEKNVFSKPPSFSPFLSGIPSCFSRCQSPGDASNIPIVTISDNTTPEIRCLLRPPLPQKKDLFEEGITWNCGATFLGGVGNFLFSLGGKNVGKMGANRKTSINITIGGATDGGRE